MAELDFQSDAFLVLLTDALQAGPGSPQWHEAVQRLREAGAGAADEYRLLVLARQRLESGREYRSVRAGPQFTRRLMAEIDLEAARLAAAPSTATMIAVASAMVMLAVLLSVGYLLWSGADDLPPPTPQGAALLVHTATSVEFDRGLAPDWRIIGSLPIRFEQGRMKPASRPTLEATGLPGGGGASWTRPLPPGEPFAVLASLRVHRPEPDLLAQVFITDQPSFSPENGTTPHELVWLLEGNAHRLVLPSGRVVAQSELPASFRGNLNVKITLQADQASVEVAGRTLWSGPAEFDPALPRYVGVRFLRRNDRAGDGVAFQNVRVNTRQP
ncbi:hypothetical protein [Fontivita pretiosa]|uniref:hypothetical protein n=1 Tax=Fontivita pretiosa TaxID=2989684 RepID=UPI003D1626EF